MNRIATWYDISASKRDSWKVMEKAKSLDRKTKIVLGTWDRGNSVDNSIPFPLPDTEGAEFLGSVFNIEAKVLNFTKPDPDLAKCVKHGVEEEIKTHFDINPKAAWMGDYWKRKAHRPSTSVQR